MEVIAVNDGHTLSVSKCRPSPHRCWCDLLRNDIVSLIRKLHKAFQIHVCDSIHSHEFPEALRELRKHTFTEVLDRNFSLESHLKSRDVKAVRKTVSGLVKLIYPNGELSKEEIAELVELSLEGRRRVKEQLKKVSSFEFHQTSFSLIDNETREEKFIGVPEQVYGWRSIM